MDISKRVYQRLRLIGYGTVPDFFCCSAKHRQQINRRTNPCPTPSHLPPLSKVRCCRPKKFGRLPEGLLAPPSLRTTFLPPLVKGEVLSPKKFGRLPKGLSHQPSQNRTIPFAFRRGASLLLPLHRTSLFPQPLQKDNNPSPHTQPFQIRTIPRKSPTPLPPLSKVRCCRPKKFGRLPEGLSH